MKSDKKKNLTRKQAVFVKEFLINFNGAEAVRKAGYKTKRPEKFAWDLRNKPDIAAAIDIGEKKLLEKLDITAERVLDELASIGFQNAQNLYDPATGELIPINKLPENVARTISSIEVISSPSVDGGSTVCTTTKIKLWDKRGSLELLGKHLKLFMDKAESPGRIDIGAISVKINHIYPNSQKTTLSHRACEAIDVSPRD